MHEIASGPKNIYKNNKNQHTKNMVVFVMCVLL